MRPSSAAWILAMTVVAACAQPGDPSTSKETVGSAPAAAPAAASASDLAMQETWRRWDEERDALMRSLPADTAKQREELVRIINTPLPSAEDRERFMLLLGDSAPHDHPLRQNEAWLRDYLKTRPPPSEQEKQAFLAGLKKTMLFVKGGTFIMGDFGIHTKEKLPISGEKNNPPHKVTLDSYSIMRGRVTYGEFDLYTRLTGRPAINVDGIRLFEHFPGYTVKPILWPDAADYCKWLADFTKLPFRLPTEAQWEYAARERGKFIAYPAHHMPEVRWANEHIPYYESLDEALSNIAAKAGKPTRLAKPRPPGLHGANRIGMQDVIGSSYEWVGDWYDADYYRHKSGPTRNPQGPPTGTKRVVRPSAYGDYRNLVVRRSELPNEEGEYMVFRCVLNLPHPWR